MLTISSAAFVHHGALCVLLGTAGEVVTLGDGRHSWLVQWQRRPRPE